MNKSVRALALLQLLIGYFVVLFLLFEWHYLDLIYGNTAAVEVMVDDAISFKKLLGWAETNNVGIIRVVEHSNGTTDIYMSKHSMEEKVSLLNGNYPKGSAFLSDINTGSEQQSGMIKSISPFHSIKIYNLDEPNNIGFFSRYYVSLSSVSQIDEMNRTLSNENIQIEFVSVFKTFDAMIAMPWIYVGRIFLFCSFGLTIALGYVLYLAKYAYQYKKKNEFKPKGCNDYIMITKSIICDKKMFLGAGAIYMFSVVFIVALKKYIYLWKMTRIFIEIYLVEIFVTCIIFAVFYLLISEYRNVLKIWEKLLRFLMLFILAVGCMLAATISISLVPKASASLKSYIRYSKNQKIYKVTMNYIGQDESLEKEIEIQNIVERTYSTLSKNNQGFIMDADSIYFCDVFGGETEMNGLYGATGQETHITVSPNYFIQNPVVDVEGESVEKRLALDENTLNLLVPEKFLYLQSELCEQFTEYLDFNRYKIHERVYKDATLDNWNPSEGSLSVNIIPIKNGQYFYTYSSKIRNKTNNSVIDPVVVVYTGNFHPSYILGVASRVLYFQYDKETKLNVDDYLNEVSGLSNFLQATSVHTELIFNMCNQGLDAIMSIIWFLVCLWEYLGALDNVKRVNKRMVLMIFSIIAGSICCIFISKSKIVRIINVMGIDMVNGVLLSIAIMMVLIIYFYITCYKEAKMNRLELKT